MWNDLVSRARARLPWLSITTGALHFSDPWVGHPGLNRRGLHVARILAADAAAALRRLEVARAPEHIDTCLHRDGVAVVEGFLPPHRFDALRREVCRHMEALEARIPIRSHGERGFGRVHPFAGGFDRWDGGTLNRYAQIGNSLPAAEQTALELAKIGAARVGARPRTSKVLVYQTVHGNEAENPDVQKELHRDTFQPAVKLWLFLEDVAADDGPFEYVLGSHRMTRERLGWEHRRARAAIRGDKSGSFRVGAADLEELGFGAPRAFAVRANTLIVADVRGFHRRGVARTDARRLALYGNYRPAPFSLRAT